MNKAILTSLTVGVCCFAVSQSFGATFQSHGKSKGKAVGKASAKGHSALSPSVSHSLGKTGMAKPAAGRLATSKSSAAGTSSQSARVTKAFQGSTRPSNRTYSSPIRSAGAAARGTGPSRTRMSSAKTASFSHTNGRFVAPMNTKMSVAVSRSEVKGSSIPSSVPMRAKTSTGAKTPTKAPATGATDSSFSPGVMAKAKAMGISPDKIARGMAMAKARGMSPAQAEAAYRAYKSRMGAKKGSSNGKSSGNSTSGGTSGGGASSGGN